MHLQQSFWLLGILAAVAVPVASAHCVGKATVQTASVSTNSAAPIIHASSQPVGITIKGVQ